MKFSLIIPFHREERTIADAVKAAESLFGGHDGEVIAVGASPYEAPFETGKGVITLAAPRGRGSQMNAGAAVASGDTLVFLHADTRLPGNALEAIAGALARDRREYGAFRLKIDSDRFWLKFISWTANVRNFFTGIPYGDQAIFMTRDLFEALGGYRDIPVMEDTDLLERAAAIRGRAVILREFAVTSARRWENEGLFYTTFMHNLMRLLRMGGASPEKIAAFRSATGLYARLRALAGREM